MTALPKQRLDQVACVLSHVLAHDLHTPFTVSSSALVHTGDGVAARASPSGVESFKLLPAGQI